MSSYDILLTGDVLGAVVDLYTNIMGFWFYAFGVFVILTMVYFKSKNLSIVAIVGLMMSAVLTRYGLLPPEGVQVLYIMMGLAVAGSIMTIVISRR